jgi:hypothetical protein
MALDQPHIFPSSLHSWDNLRCSDHHRLCSASPRFHSSSNSSHHALRPIRYSAICGHSRRRYGISPCPHSMRCMVCFPNPNTRNRFRRPLLNGIKPLRNFAVQICCHRSLPKNCPRFYRRYSLGVMPVFSLPYRQARRETHWRPMVASKHLLTRLDISRSLNSAGRPVSSRRATPRGL